MLLQPLSTQGKATPWLPPLPRTWDDLHRLYPRHDGFQRDLRTGAMHISASLEIFCFLGRGSHYHYGLIITRYATSCSRLGAVRIT